MIRHQVLIAFILLVLPVAPQVVSAFTVPCINRDLSGKVRDIVKVSIIEDEGEIGRQTEEEYASGGSADEVRDRFAATGVLKCKKSYGSAQLTGGSQIITTSAHLFKSPNCDEVNVDTGCIFIVKDSQGEQKVKVSRVLASGFKCPPIPETQDDWAVVKLSEPIKNIKPYRIPKVWDRLEENMKVTAVTGSATDFHRKSPSGEKVFPKAIEDCRTGPIYRIGWGETTCDIGPGASGGSLVRESPKGDVLVAINKGNSSNKAELERELRGLAVKKKYQEDVWAAKAIPVEGKFLEALELYLREP